VDWPRSSSTKPTSAAGALVLTPAGRDHLGAAVPVWRETHAAIEDAMGPPGADRLRADLRALS
jgi:hypothetical protein